MVESRTGRPVPGPECKTVYVVRVRFCDTDLMGIVHHAKYLEYFEAGRVEYMHRRGVSYRAWTERGIHLPVVEMNVRYRKSVRFDERLAVETTLRELSRASVRFDYRVFRVRADDDGATATSADREIVAEGKSLLACVGNDLALRRIPDDVAELLCSAETHRRAVDQA